MGAYDISFEIRGKKASFSEIKEAFEDKRAQEASEHGHQQGYSGDFQTVHGVKLKDITFDDFDSAYEYVLDHTEKRGNALAVYFKEGDVTSTLIGGWGAS